MAKQNITQYSDQELSLLFNNDEGLYHTFIKSHSFSQVKGLADDLFIYTDEQMAELEDDWNTEQETDQ